MDNQKRVIIGHTLGAFGYGLVGVIIFSWGSSYFKERLLYNVPRILSPVFDIFGNIGLAIGMLVLGGGLIYYGFTQWKIAWEKTNLYWIIAVPALVVGIALANINFSSQTAEEIMEQMNQDREEQLEALRNSGDLNFSHPEVDAHIAVFNDIYKRLENAESKDRQTYRAIEEEIGAWSMKSPEIMEKLSAQQKGEFGRYLAKLTLQWHELSAKYLDEID